MHSFMLPVQFLDTVLDMPVVVLRRSSFVSAEICGFSAVAVHRRRLPSSFADADPHGPDCSADHRDSSDAVRF